MSNYEWPVDFSVLPTDLDETQQLVLEQSLDAAVAVLWALTGRWYGVQAVEARPCSPGRSPVGIPLEFGRGWQPVLDAGTVRNVSVMPVSCRDNVINLPGPVVEVLGWVVDGDEMELAGLQVYGDAIMRTAGGAWPSQDLSLPSTEPGTWAVRYLRGHMPPPGAAHMVGLLAREFYNGATGGTCRLPRRVTNVQRQGVTVSMVDPTEIFDSGATGITEVDLWIKSVNPYRLHEPSKVWSPDLSIWE